jgi:hypothetical protein
LAIVEQSGFAVSSGVGFEFIIMHNVEATARTHLMAQSGMPALRQRIDGDPE